MLRTINICQVVRQVSKFMKLNQECLFKECTSTLECFSVNMGMYEDCALSNQLEDKLRKGVRTESLHCKMKSASDRSYFTTSTGLKLSRVIRKPNFCCAVADQRLVLLYTSIEQSLYFLNSKV